MTRFDMTKLDLATISRDTTPVIADGVRLPTPPLSDRVPPRPTRRAPWRSTTGDTAWVLIELRPRAADDARPGVLLRRHGPRQERPQHDDDELRRASASSASCGCSTATRSPFGTDTNGRSSAASRGRSGCPARSTSAVSGTTSRRCAFVAFQLMFAIITLALISGALADRAKFGAWVVFVALWVDRSSTSRSRTGCSTSTTATGGWHRRPARGVIDFAGGTAVHINAGAAALGAGPRPRQARRLRRRTRCGRTTCRW